ncbi:MAG: SCO1664 family protein [Chloroflexi bacterium]|nr:SCO1664 family protein [Chloroflexota bacterium]
MGSTHPDAAYNLRTVAPALLMSEQAPFPDDPFALLEHGTIEGIELIPWGSNYTFAALIRAADGACCYSVYKPRRGEVPLRDFPSGTLYKREVAAYVLARWMGWDLVPPTIVREEGPHGIGSLQLYVEPESGAAGQYDRLRETHRCDLQRMAIFDLLINNADRKGGHCLLDVRGHMWGIDHGLTFHHVPKLRTVIWDFCGEPFPDVLVQQLSELRADGQRVTGLERLMRPLLSAQEIETLFLRWDRLLVNPCFPQLDPYRNVPWPPF